MKYEYLIILKGNRFDLFILSYYKSHLHEDHLQNMCE